MPSKKKPAPAWKEYPEPEFPNDKARDAYREAKGIIKDAWLRMQAGEEVTDLGYALSGIGFTALPPEIGQLTALTGLYLQNNQLTALPPVIGQLTALTVLWLQNNQLTVLPPEIGQLSALTELHLYNNQLTALPPEIRQLTALTELRLSYNQVTALPPEIGQLTALTVLSFSDNQLTALPPEIGRLAALKVLSLSDNQLTALPPEIGQLTALTVLYLSRNQLTALPPELRKLTKLRGLYLHGNDALGLPPEVLGKTWRETGSNHEGAAEPRGILEYYFALREAQATGRTRPLNEAKVLFLGQPEAGKSSVIYALTRGTPTPDFPQTDGIAREQWCLPVREGKVVAEGSKGAERLRLNLWDFGGQEIYKATHTYFLTRRAVYVIVTTARKDVDPDLEEWLETAKTFGAGAPVWVVINKHDEHPNGGPDEVELMRKYYPMLRGFIRTQCQHGRKGPEKGKGAGRGIAELQDRLVAEAWAIPEVRQEMTMSALAIKEHLEGMEQPTLSLTDYRKLCEEKGEAAQGQQATLLDLWDKLGTVRYFPEDEKAAPAFKDTAILNPDWVTAAVYRVLEDRALKEAKGLVTEADLDRITSRLKHPAGGYHLIAHVMRRFSQLYDTGDGRMFVPQLLEDREPRLDWPAGALRFVYQYPVLPAGLVPAFIAMMVGYHDKKVPPWRRGCVLSVKGCRVLVLGDKKARTVDITVAPGATDAREALDVVRHALEGMHMVFAGGQEVAELIPVPGFPKAPLLDYRWLRTLEREGETGMLVPVDEAKSGMTEITIAEVLGGVRTAGRRAQELEQDARGMDRGGRMAELPDPMPGSEKQPPQWKVAAAGGLAAMVAAGLVWFVPVPWKYFLSVGIAVAVFLLWHNPSTKWWRAFVAAASLGSMWMNVSFQLKTEDGRNWVAFGSSTAVTICAMLLTGIGAYRETFGRRT